jgi:ERCC4-type nuclease
MAKYNKADKLPIVYAIVAPDGKQYIGQTMMHLGVRRSEHIRHYKRALKGKRERLPLLHDSFDKYGYNEHQFKVVKELPNVNRKQLRAVESSYITLNKAQNISLNSTN